MFSRILDLYFLTKQKIDKIPIYEIRKKLRKNIFCLIFCFCWGKGNAEEEKVKLEDHLTPVKGDDIFFQMTQKIITNILHNFSGNRKFCLILEMLAKSKNFRQKSRRVKMLTKTGIYVKN